MSDAGDTGKVVSLSKRRKARAQDAERAKEMMAEVEDPSQVDPERLDQVVNEDLLKEKILAWLKENSEVELVPEGTLAPEEPENADDDADSVAVPADDSDAEAVEVEVVKD